MKDFQQIFRKALQFRFEVQFEIEFLQIPFKIINFFLPT